MNEKAAGDFLQGDWEHAHTELRDTAPNYRQIFPGLLTWKTKKTEGTYMEAFLFVLSCV